MLGVYRLLLGLGFGIVIWLASSLVVEKVDSQVLAYFVVYLPIRWIEWAIIDSYTDEKSNFLFGLNKKHRLWRCGGIVISCLADIPIFITMGGLPLGRFMC